MDDSFDNDASALAQSCTQFSASLKDALSWIGHAGNAERLGHEKRAIEEELRRTAYQANKLARSATEPMCVGVFGPSQAGKSYLVSVLARKASRLMAVFDDPRGQIDFLKDLNPGGGTEATGLVTRFTIHPIKTPPGFPVALRLLSQTDIVKIIVNAYVNDGDLDAERLPTREELSAHLEEIEKGSASEYADTLREEDVWDLQDYVQRHFRRIGDPLSAYWDRIAYLAPRVPLARRAALYSILWGRHEALTRLYAKLADALARLGNATEAFAPMDALFPAQTGILNVTTLAAVAADTPASLRIATAGGASAELPRPVVAALTAELRVVVAERPWDFFEHTDLLDFPGYRSRKKEKLQQALAEAPESTVANMLLRGKVAYLFQRYTQDQELTSMLLCLRDSNLEVTTLDEVVEEWIGITHGVTAPERAGRPVLLFFCLTMFDLHLIEVVAPPAERFAARLYASLIKPFGANKPGTWPMNWTPGKLFDNCFWIRNPNAKAESVIEYDDDREVRIRPAKVARLAEMRAEYGTVPAVQQHFKDPLRAWNEVMKLNDGGIGYLAGELAQVCRPDMKTDQLRARLSALRRRTGERLSRYYVTTDLAKRLAERDAVCEQILESIQQSHDRERFGTFLYGLCIDRVQLGDALYAARTGGAAAEPAGKVAAAPPTRSIVGVLRGARRNGPAIQPAQRVSGNIRLASAAVQAWASHMQRMAESEPFGRTVGIPTPLIGEIVAEISGAARRKKLAEAIAARLDRVLHIENVDAIIAKTTLVASRVLNGFVGNFGYDAEPPAQRPKVMFEDGAERPVFDAGATVHDASGIGAERAAFAYDYTLDWCSALQTVIRENASTEDGSMQDPAQNARLGAILEGLRGS